MPRPQDNDFPRLGDDIADLGAIIGAPDQVPIPPDGDTFLLERLREALGDGPVLARVADEDVGRHHRLPGRPAFRKADRTPPHYPSAGGLSCDASVPPSP